MDMTPKPQSGDGYESTQLENVRLTCLYMATKLGDLLDEIVVVGGLVPYFLVDQQNLPPGMHPHAGTMDLDMGLALALLNQERYRELSARLRDAGFAPAVNDEGNPKLQSWTTGTDQPVTIDFLIPTSDDTDTGGSIFHIESDLAAITTRGLELAFQDRCWKELSGTILSGARATRKVPVCGPGAFTVLKALSFGNRTENKDAYDLFYVWTGVGVEKIAGILTQIRPNVHIDSALAIIEKDFTELDGLGPMGTALFIARAPDDDIQADVVGQARALLRSAGRL